MAHIVSIQVGKTQQHGTEGAENPLERPWESSIFKYPVTGAVMMRTLNIDGDAQTDLVNHGGEDKAVMAYGLGHYAYWRETLPEIDWVNGGFGENLTIDGHTEDDVCIGDIYQIGAARVQVSQPRQPCWKLARRWLLKDLTARVQQNGYSGWYFRVLAEGEIDSGMALELLERPHPDWTVRRATDVLTAAGRNPEVARGDGRELANLPPLATSWREYLEKKAAQ